MDLAALGSRSFRLYVAANFFSLVGIWINRILIGWLAWDLTASAAWVGILSSLQLAPTLVAGPLFGVIADRIDIRRGALATQAALTLLILALWSAHEAGALDVAMLAGISLLLGLTASANHPIRLAMVPLLVRRDAIPNAVTLISINFNTARLIGPAIGGLMIERLGLGPTMLASFALVLPMLAAILTLEPRARKSAAADRPGIAAELLDGMRQAALSHHIRLAMAVTAITAVVARGALEVLPAIADGIYGRGSAGLGQMLSAAGAGALVAGLSIAAAGRGRDHVALLARSLWWMGLGVVAVIVLGMVHSWPAALACVFALGASGTFTSVYTQSAVQLETADAYRGRVISLWLFVGMGSNAAGALGLGLLADYLSIKAALATLGLCGLAASLACAASSRMSIRPPAGKS